MNETHQVIWEKYAASWKAESSVERQAIFASCLTPTCQYSDPLVQTNGWDELATYMENLQQQVPGVHFVTSYFQSHHDRSIAKWEMRSGDNTPITQGVSYGEFNEDGMLVSMSGFYELPQG